LVAGRGDIAAANLTITPERGQLVAFSEPFARGVSELPVTTRRHQPISCAEDLVGLPVYVRYSSSYYESLEGLNARLRAAERPLVQMHTVNESLEDEDILEMVQAGLLPAAIVDSHLAQVWSRVWPALVVHSNAAVRTGGQIAWALRKNSPQLAALINDFVRTHRQGTLLGNVILHRYLRSVSYLTNAAASTELKKFNATIGLFRRYGAQYSFDALMLAALGYQESTLDQRARSHHGAVGVMQLMPATAADPKIGIPRIDSVENNIHAGTKYLRWLHDTYFKDARMDALNRTLFTFAAYNAGPGRIAKLRAQAGPAGLNANVWFGNVEVLAAREIGRETVQYVSNIFRYYLAYALITQHERERADALHSPSTTAFPRRAAAPGR
jgi:membrane-bound lytic murein transglycosylase MltF